MKLSVKERIEISGVLPQKGSFEKLIIKADLVEKIKITQDDIEKYNITTLENGNIAWNVPKGESDSVDFKLSDSEKEYLKDVLKDMSDKGEFPENMIAIYKQVKG